MEALDIDAVEQQTFELLLPLCRLPSVSAEGRALKETADLVESMLAQSGFMTRQLRGESGPPLVWGELRGRNEWTLLLYNHYDVQPADPLELWDSPPFEPSVRDGKLFARGVADNKAQIALRLAAIAAFGGEPPVTIRWIIEGEEEVASPNFEDIVGTHRELFQADGCLWEGGDAVSDGLRPDVALGVKGVLAVRLDLKLLSGDAHSGFANVVPSAPWRLVEALGTLRDTDGRVTVDGLDEAVRSPTEQELRVVGEPRPDFERELRAAYGIERFVSDLQGGDLRLRQAFAPSLNIAGLHAGYGGPGMKTVLPAQASAWLDFRLVPEQQADRVLELLRAHLDQRGFNEIEITPLAKADPAATPLDDPFVGRCVAVTEAIYGETPWIVPMIGGSLPFIASLQRHVGMPGLSVCDNPTYYGCAAHAPNENIRLADIKPAAQYFHTLLAELGAESPPPGDGTAVA